VGNGTIKLNGYAFDPDSVFNTFHTMTEGLLSQQYAPGMEQIHVFGLSPLLRQR
jgi:hypothetical protein